MYSSAVGARHELLIQALLPDADAEFVVQEALLEPDFPQPRRRHGRDAADILQVAYVVDAQAAATDVHGAQVERAAIPAERLGGVELDRQRGQRVIGRAPLQPARDIAHHLLDIGQADGDAVIRERGTQATHVTQKLVPLQNTLGLRFGGGRGHWWHGGSYRGSRRLRERLMRRNGGDTKTQKSQCGPAISVPRGSHRPWHSRATGGSLACHDQCSACLNLRKLNHYWPAKTITQVVRSSRVS